MHDLTAMSSYAAMFALLLALISVPAAAAGQQCSMAKWFQKEFKLPAYRRGCHLVTNKVLCTLPGSRSVVFSSSLGVCPAGAGADIRGPFPNKHRPMPRVQ